jgi:hypothetical protein
MAGFIRDSFKSVLGGGIPGGQPKGGLLGGGAGVDGGSGMEGGGDRGLSRFVLRETKGQSIIKTPIITPFRKALHAGDQAGTRDSAPSPDFKASNMVTRESVSRLRAQYGGVHNDGKAVFSGNPRYVYDGSDYVRYRKLKAINKTYNDLSFGGSNNGSYVALMAIRRF